MGETVGPPGEEDGKAWKRQGRCKSPKPPNPLRTLCPGGWMSPHARMQLVARKKSRYKQNMLGAAVHI